MFSNRYQYRKNSTIKWKLILYRPYLANTG